MLVSHNYNSIIKNLLYYMPSRGLIILNSLLIIPLLTGILDPKEMSIYFIAIQILNLICTCSFDGIGKAVLRFYEKYKIQERTNRFLSTIFWLTIIAYLIILVLYPLYGRMIVEKYSISHFTLLLTLLLVIPCGIRQIVYQILRIKNLSNIYTYSIIFYQVIFICCFLSLTRIIPDTDMILLSMGLAVFIIDFYAINKLALSFKLEYVIDKEVVKEVLKYIMPLFFTNFCYWFILNYLKFAFQHTGQYMNTAVIGTTWIIANNFIQPLVTLFIFSTFPIIIKKFEHKNSVKGYFTNILQLYIFIFIPILSVFCLFAEDVRYILLSNEYAAVASILPIFSICVFMHEFLKLINIKYHLENKTYIETFLAILFVVFSYFATVYAVENQSIVMATAVVLICEIGLLFVNLLIRFKNLNQINYGKVLKTFVGIVLVCGVCFCLISLIDVQYSKILCSIRIVIFTILSYIFAIGVRKILLS